MSVEVLRTFSDPFYRVSVSLDGSDFVLEWRYNQREDRWYFDISLTNGTILVRGVKVVCGVPLLSRFADSRLPKGQLIALSSRGNEAPGVEELGEGKRVRLVYVSRSELE